MYITHGGMMIEDMPNLPGGPAGGISILVAGVIGGILWLRKFLSRDATDRSTDGAYKDAMEALRAQIKFSRDRADAADARADTERARADKLMASLDAATEQIGQLRAQVSDLSRQVGELQRQLKVITPTAGPI